MRTINTLSKVLLSVSMISLIACTKGGTSAPSTEVPIDDTVPVAPEPVDKTVQALSAAASVTIVTCSNGTQGLRVVLADGSQADVACGGSAGATGATGAVGASGAAGAAGVQGLQGVAGSTGPSGPQGIQGIQGIPGIPGIPGSSGSGSAGFDVYDGNALVPEMSLLATSLVTTSGLDIPRHVLWSKTAGAAVHYNSFGSIIRGVNLYYELANCAGRQYMKVSNAVAANTMLIHNRDGAGIGLPEVGKKTRGPLVLAIFGSQYNTGTGGCSNVPINTSGMEVEDYTIPAYIPTSFPNGITFRAAQ